MILLITLTALLVVLVAGGAIWMFEGNKHCPNCGSTDLEHRTIESVRGAGAGPGFLECQECMERFNFD